MRYFFKSTRFKVISGIAGGLIILMIIVRALGGWASPQSGIVGAIVTPVQRFSATISSHIKSTLFVYSEVDELKKQNSALRKDMKNLSSKIIEYDKMQQENKIYKEFYDIKESNPTFKLVDSRMVSYDPSDAFGAFTIDKGSLAGIAPRDPVITSDGLVGYIFEAAPTYSTVITILSPDLSVSASDSRTTDSGSVSGNIELAEKGLCRMSYLSRQSSAAAGDYIITSGVGGNFPEGLLIGTILEIKNETQNISRYATIKPAAQLDKISSIMVITSFGEQK